MDLPDTYDELRETLGRVAATCAGRRGDRLAAYALAAPDLFVLFGRVLADGRIARAQRGELIASALYVLSPVDVIPEALFGPLGLVDDAAVIARFFDTLLNGVPIEIVREHWPGDVHVLERLQDLAAEGRRVFGGGLRGGIRQLAARAIGDLRRRVAAAVQTPRRLLGARG